MYSRRLRRLILFSNCRALRRISSNGMGVFSTGCFFQTPRMSLSGRGSFGMATSLVKCARQDVLDAVNLGSDVARRKAGDLADGRRVHALQIGEDDLAIQRLQALHQSEQAAERLLAAGVWRRGVGYMFEFFQADQHVGVQ